MLKTESKSLKPLLIYNIAGGGRWHLKPLGAKFVEILFTESILVRAVLNWMCHSLLAGELFWEEESMLTGLFSKETKIQTC